MASQAPGIFPAITKEFPARPKVRHVNDNVKYNAIPSEETRHFDKSPNELDLGFYDSPMLLNT
jgi:hypothetical protein